MRVLIAFGAILVLCCTALPAIGTERVEERLNEVDTNTELLNQCYHIVQNDINQCISTHPDESMTTVELTTVTEPTEHTTSSIPHRTDTEPPTEKADEEEFGGLQGGLDRSGGRREDEEDKPTIYVVHIDRSDAGEAEVYAYPYVASDSKQFRKPSQPDEPPTNLLGFPGEEPTSSSPRDPYFVIVDDSDGDGEPDIYIARTISNNRKHKGPHHKKFGKIDDQLLHWLLWESDGSESHSDKWLMWFKNRPTEHPDVTQSTEHPELTHSTEHPKVTHSTEYPVVTHMTKHPKVTTSTEPVYEHTTQPVTTEHPEVTQPIHEHHTSPPTESMTDTPTNIPTDTNTTSPTTGSWTTSNITSSATGSPTTNSTTSPTTVSPTTGNITSPTIGIPTTSNITSPTTGSPTTNSTTSPTTGSPTTNNIASPTTGSLITNSTSSPTTDSPATSNITSPTTNSPATNTTIPTLTTPRTDDNLTTGGTNPPTASTTNTVATDNATSIPETTASDIPTIGTHDTETPTTGFAENHTTDTPTIGDGHQTDSTDAANNTSSAPVTDVPTGSTGSSTDAPTTDLTRNGSTNAPTTTPHRNESTDSPTRDTPAVSTNDGGSSSDLFPTQGDTDVTTDITEPPSENSDHIDPTIVEPRDDMAQSYLVVNIDRSKGEEQVSTYIVDDASSQSLGGNRNSKKKGKGKDRIIIDRDKKITVVIVINEGDLPTSLPTSDPQVLKTKVEKPEDDLEEPLYPKDDYEPVRNKEDESDSSKMIPVPVHEAKKTKGTYGYGKAVDDAIDFALQASRHRKRAAESMADGDNDAPTNLPTPTAPPTTVSSTETPLPPAPTARECLKLFSQYIRQYYLQMIDFVDMDTKHPTR